MGKCVGKAGAFYLPRLHALLLDAANENVTVTDPTGGELDFIATDNLTIEIWAKVNATGDGNVLQKYDTNKGYKVEVATNKMVFTIGDGTNQPAITSTTSANDDKWHCWHLVRHIADDKIYLYLDGVSDATGITDSTTTTLATAVDLVWGGATNTRTIGAVTIFNTALTVAQCLKRHNGEAVSALQEYIVGDWLSLSGTGAVLYDDSGNANDGTITNATWSTITYDTVTGETPTGSGKIYDTANANIRTLVVKDGGVAIARSGYTYTVKGHIVLTDTPSGAVTCDYIHYHVVELGGFFSWSLDWVGETVDSTDFVDASGGYRTFLPGLKTWTGTAEQHWANKSISADIGGTQMIVKFYYASGDRYEGWAIVTGLSVTTPFDALVDASLSFQGDEVLSIETT